MDCELNKYVYDCEECGFCERERNKMTNAEKYREEIENYSSYKFCEDFVKPKILKVADCKGTDCIKCALHQLLWLMDEYKEEPEVDWSKVAVDTPIFVKDRVDETWYKRHFAKFENGKVYTWRDGKTSWSSACDDISWECAKLAEEGDE